MKVSGKTYLKIARMFGKDLANEIAIDEEIWRTAQNGKHYQLQTKTGQITKGNIGGATNVNTPTEKNLSTNWKSKADASKYTTAHFDEGDWINENVDYLMQNGIEDWDEARVEWEKAMMERSTTNLHEMDQYDTADVIRDNMPMGLHSAWFQNADSSVKPKLEGFILTNPQLRNAGLNMAYNNYKTLTGSDVSFEDFLTTPITVYRGTHGQQQVKDDVWSSFSYDKKMAQKFGSDIEEIKIRPIDTFGDFTTNAEAEILVPRIMLEQIRKGANDSSFVSDGGVGSGQYDHSMLKKNDFENNGMHVDPESKDYEKKVVQNTMKIANSRGKAIRNMVKNPKEYMSGKYDYLWSDNAGKDMKYVADTAKKFAIVAKVLGKDKAVKMFMIDGGPPSNGGPGSGNYPRNGAGKSRARGEYKKPGARIRVTRMDYAKLHEAVSQLSNNQIKEGFATINISGKNILISIDEDRGFNVLKASKADNTVRSYRTQSKKSNKNKKKERMDKKEYERQYKRKQSD